MSAADASRPVGIPDPRYKLGLLERVRPVSALRGPGAAMADLIARVSQAIADALDDDSTAR